jgi:pimeloyl-ACP methyl ester carboxylesterase
LKGFEQLIEQEVNATWTGMVPVDDTALAVTDTGGPGVPVVYLNGHMASQRNWKRVITELGPSWRHITYDMRARGRSKLSADYSFETAVRDVDAVLAARGVERALVVGWSYGAFVAAHWASRHPDRAIGAVLIEGAQPNDWIDEMDIEGMRQMWRRLSWLFVLMRWTAWWTGIVPRMTAAQMANSNIEVGMIARERELGPVLDNIMVPTRYVNASGSELGREDVRASLDPVVQRNPNIKIYAKVPSKHDNILRKDFRAVAKAVREVASLDHGGH